MAQLPIYNCFHPLMKKKTEDVTEIDSNIKKLVEDMFETMYKDDGIGLAANQVGVSKSLIVVDTSVSSEEKYRHPPIVMLNPEIEDESVQEVEMSEGCLSIPKFNDKVWRPEKIQVRYFDLNGNQKVIEANDLLSRVIQHEIDHLDGILFYERLSAIRKTLAKSKLRKIEKGLIIPDYPMIQPDGQKV
ncbi:MAG: peptide deformylase [bacterium]